MILAKAERKMRLHAVRRRRLMSVNDKLVQQDLNVIYGRSRAVD